MFHVGQKVVCYREFPQKFSGLLNIPIKDCIYTIRGIHDFGGEWLGLLLEEVINAEAWCNSPNGRVFAEPAPNAMYFRPLIERKLPECLTALLRQPAPKSDRVPAISNAEQGA